MFLKRVNGGYFPAISRLFFKLFAFMNVKMLEKCNIYVILTVFEFEKLGKRLNG